jgi:cbb3-type cytochrome oxidase subunit 3
MTYVIFAGDMFVMAFMIAVVVWVSTFTSDAEIDKAARLPFEDGEDDG